MPPYQHLPLTHFFVTINDAVADATLVFRSLYETFQNITDPKFVNNLANILTIVSAYARFKGESEFANFLGNAADKAGTLAQKLQDIRDNGGFNLEETANKAKKLDTVLKALEFSIGAVKLAASGFIALQIAKQFDLFNNSVAKLELGMANLASRITPLSAVFNSRFNPGLIKLTEIATVVTPLVFGFGKALSESEDAAISFIGKITIAASILTGAFATAVTLGIKLISDFTISLGDRIIETMDKFSKISAKSESVLQAFNFTLQGFNRVVGDSVGTLEFWEHQIQNIVKSSTFASNEIRKGISLLVKEGAALGLDAEKNARIARIAADVAASTGREFADVSQRIIEGLAGQSEGLLALGINVRETHLEHSEFLKQLGKTTSELSDAEKKTIRFNEVIKQTKPLIGAATAAIDTVEGATAVYNRTLEAIQIRIGEANTATKFYLKTLSNLSTMFLGLPDPILEVLGTLIDITGVTLKVVGTFVKYLLTIGFVVAALNILNKTMAQSFIIVSGLQIGLGMVAAKMGVKVIAVNSLSTALTQMLLIVRGGLLITLKTLAVSIASLTFSIMKFTATLLINPLFFKAAIIAFAIGAVIKAVIELSKELEFLTFNLEGAGVVTQWLGKAFEFLKTIVSGVFGVFVDLSKVIVGGMVRGVLMLTKSWKQWQFIFASDQNERDQFKKDIDEINENIRRVDESINASLGGLKKVWGNSSAQAKELKNNLDYESVLVANAESVNKMAKSFAKLNAEAIRLGVFGDEFDQMNLRVKQAEDNFAAMFTKFSRGAELSKENLEEITTAFAELTRASNEFEKLRQDTFANIAEQTKSLNDEMFRMGASEIEIIKNTGAQRLAEFNKRIDRIRSVFAVTAEEENKIAAMQVALAAKTQMEIEAVKEKARKEAEQKAAQSAQKELSFAESLSQKIRQFKVEELQAAGNLVKAQQIENNNALAAFDDKIAAYVKEQKAIESNFKLREKELALIEKTRDALIAKGEANVTAAARKEQEAAQKALGDQGPELFGPQQVKLIEGAFGDAAGQLAGSASAFMGPAMAMMSAAQMIVRAIQQLIDFAPNFINSVANIFTSLTDLPENLFKAVLNLGESIDYFVENFADNLAEFLPKLIETFQKIGAKLLITLGVELPLRIIGVMFSLKFWKDVAISLANGFIEGIKEGINNLANALGLADIFNINAEEKLEQLGDEIRRASDQLFKVVELEQVSRGLDIADRIRNALASGSSKGASFFERLFKKIKQFGQDLWDGFKEAVGKALNWFKEKGGAIWRGLKEAADKALNWFKEKGTAIWNGFKEAVGKAVNWFEEKGGAIWTGFKNAIGDAVAWFKEKGGAIWRGLKEAAGNILEVFKNWGKNIWNGLKEAAGAAGEELIKFGEKIWDGLKNAIKWPEIETPGWLQSFISAVDRLTNWSLPFSSGGLVGAVKNSVTSGASTVTKVVDKVTSFFSEGGPVTSVPHGMTKNGVLYAQTGALSRSQGTDTIPAMLTPGEFVVNREATRNNLGLLSFINQNKDSVAPGAPQTSTFHITINAKTNLSVDQIRREVVPELEKQLRRRSQEGRSVINAAGIRA